MSLLLFSLSEMNSPSEGDQIAFLLKGTTTYGTVVKKSGLRFRIEHAGGLVWAELNDITEILTKGLTKTTTRASPMLRKWPPEGAESGSISPTEKVRLR